MMTEEQLIDRICLTCVDVRNSYTDDTAQGFINDIRALAEQLAALTQPASPALKLPDAPPNALVALCEQMYDHRSTGATVAHDVWQDCIEELLMDAPHAAPIEPICATGGAEWVKCSDRMPAIKDGSWRTPLPVLVLCELGVIPAYARTYTTIGGEKKVGFMASLTLGNARGKHPESLYSSEVLTQVTMWRDMPAAPEEK